MHSYIINELNSPDPMNFDILYIVIAVGLDILLATTELPALRDDLLIFQG